MIDTNIVPNQIILLSMKACSDLHFVYLPISFSPQFTGSQESILHMDSDDVIFDSPSFPSNLISPVRTSTIVVSISVSFRQELGLAHYRVETER